MLASPMTEPDSSVLQKTETPSSSYLSSDHRKNRYGTINFIPIASGPLLGWHSGFNLSAHINGDWSIGGEYLYEKISFGILGIDFASIYETYTMINARYFWGSNSFTTTIGLGTRTFSLTLGDSTIAILAPQASLAEFSVFEVSSTILTMAVGNHWQFDNRFHLGFDWIELYIPFQSSQETPDFSKVESSTKRATLNDIGGMLAYIPTFNFLKVYVGYAF
jgi:hypothetical protein